MKARAQPLPVRHLPWFPLFDLTYQGRKEGRGRKGKEGKERRKKRKRGREEGRKFKKKKKKTLKKTKKFPNNIVMSSAKIITCHPLEPK